MKSTILAAESVVPATRLEFVAKFILGSASFLPYLVAGKLAGCPGIGFRLDSCAIALRSFITEGYQSFLRAHRQIIGPMDSTRYFEYDFAERAYEGLEVRDYLDVSSPNLLPLTYIRKNRGVNATLLNPDDVDLRSTQRMVEILHLGGQCSFKQCLIGDCDYASSFDLVTSISVVEHIPNDIDAIKVMWRSLRPGGRLVLTVPCAREPYEEFAEFNQFGILAPEKNGTVFWQRFYSNQCLVDRIFPIAGRPRQIEVYGEVEPGSYDENVKVKRRTAIYPSWREPWYMAKGWKTFSDIGSLPGVGVVGMMFTKDS